MLRSIKCVVCGDAAVGKSALCVAFTTSAFVAEYTPTLYDQFVANVMVDGKPSRLVLYDTSGDEDYDPLRSLCFPGARVFLLAFSVASRASLEAVRRKWASEVRQHDPRVPLVLVGTQADLRDDPAHKRKLVQPEEVSAERPRARHRVRARARGESRRPTLRSRSPRASIPGGGACHGDWRLHLRRMLGA